jgi:hypothetical protein
MIMRATALHSRTGIPSWEVRPAMAGMEALTRDLSAELPSPVPREPLGEL